MKLEIRNTAIYIVNHCKSNRSIAPTFRLGRKMPPPPQRALAQIYNNIKYEVRNKKYDNVGHNTLIIKYIIS